MTLNQKIILHSENETTALAVKIGNILKPADIILLYGEIGAGKSFLCRALLHHIFSPELEVPSPTFTLVQTYEGDEMEYWHCDLYRLNNPEEAIELGLDEAFETAICLIEWPDRLGSLIPKRALSIFMKAEDGFHSATLVGNEAWQNRLGQSLA